MKISESLIRKAIRDYLLVKTFPVLLEGADEREQIFATAPGMKAIYDFYKTNTEEDKISNISFDHTELRWIYNNFERIKNELNSAADVDLKNYTKPLIKSDIEIIIDNVIDFLREKDNLTKLYNQYSKSLTQEEIENNKILGADIFKYSSLSDLRKAISHFRNVDEITGSGKLEDNIKLGSFNGYELTVPQNKKASLRFDSDPEHQTTTWCTTRRSGQNLFDGYTLNGGILFYLKKADVDDEAAAEKNKEGRYTNPYNRFCIGIKKAESKPNFPKKGEGFGGLIVDQNNNGVWEEKAKELLGSEFESAIKAIIDYNQKVNNQLPFAKNFGKIIKSVKAVKETIDDWTWPEKYDFLINQNNRNSILRLSAGSNTEPSAVVIKFAENFKAKHEKELNKIFTRPSGQKAATYCFYGMKKFKRVEICNKIINEKLMKEDSATVTMFFNIVFENETLDCFQQEGIPNSLVDKYIGNRLDFDFEITNFDTWVSNSDSIYEKIRNPLREINDKAESSKCKVAKREVKKRLNVSGPKKLNRIFVEVSKDIAYSDNFDEAYLKNYFDEYTKLSNFNNELYAIETSPVFSEFQDKCINNLRENIMPQVSEKLRRDSQSLNANLTLKVLDRLFSVPIENLSGLIFKIFDKRNLLPNLEQLDLFNKSKKSAKRSIENNLVKSFFIDMIEDNDPLNLQKFGMIVNKHPANFYKVIMKLKKDQTNYTILDRFNQEMLQGNQTLIQDFFIGEGKQLLGYSSVLSQYIIKSLAKNASGIEQEAISSFFKKLSNSGLNNNTNKQLSRVLASLSSHADQLSQDFETLYGFLVSIISDSSEWSLEDTQSWRSGYSIKTKKDEMIYDLLSSMETNNIPLLSVFNRLVEDNIKIHSESEDFNVISVIGQFDSVEENQMIDSYVKYVVNNLENIKTVNTFSIQSFTGIISISYEEFKKIYAAVGGERIAHFFFMAFNFEWNLSTQQQIEFIKMIEFSINKYEIKHPSIPDDPAEFSAKALNLMMKSAKSIEELLPYAKLIKENSQVIFNYFLEYMSSHDETFVQYIVSNVDSESTETPQPQETETQVTTDQSDDSELQVNQKEYPEEAPPEDDIEPEEADDNLE